MHDSMNLRGTRTRTESPRRWRRLARPAALLSIALVCGTLGGGIVTAHQGEALRWHGQLSSKTLSVEAALLLLYDPSASDAARASAQTVLRTAFSDCLPRVVLLRSRGGEIGARAAALIAELGVDSGDHTPSFLRDGTEKLRFREAMLLLERGYGSTAARRLALERIGEVLTDTRHALERIRGEGGESGEMARIHLAWFRSFLALPLPAADR